MSGGEIAGLALGTVALASLFQTCVELLDYIEVVKAYEDDRDTAWVKFGLLRQRFHNWGTAVRILEPGKEDLALQEQRDIVKRSLLRLELLLSNSELLVRKYELGGSAKRSLTLRRRTFWAVYDKRKFERLIGDITFIMDNLQKVTKTSRTKFETSQTVWREQVVTSRVSNPVVRRDGWSVDDRPLSVRDGKTKPLEPNSYPDDGDDQSTEDEEEHIEAPRSERQTRCSDEKLPKAVDRQAVVSGTQRNKNQRVAFLGTDRMAGAAVISGQQDNEDGGFAFMGVWSSDLVLKMHEQHLRSELEKRKLAGDPSMAGD